MSKRFELTVRGTVVLGVEQIWPDGDAPDNPSAADVEAVISEEGGFARVLCDWSLEDAFDFCVYEVVSPTAKVKP
jgi:hypothetical protein